MAQLYTISDEFNQPLGKWQVNSGGGSNPWDSTVFWFDSHPASADDFLTDQQHVDIRSFRQVSAYNPRPQFPDLDSSPQNPGLDTVFQTDLELKAGSTFTENWTMSGSGMSTPASGVVMGQWELTHTYSSGDVVEYKGKFYEAQNSTQGEFPDGLSGSWSEIFFVGKLDNHGGWYGLQVVSDGNVGGFYAEIYSAIPGDNLDISGMDNFSLIFPDFNNFSLAESFIILTSNPTGGTGTSSYNSDNVYLNANTSTLPEFKVALSDFVSGAGTNFDLTKITGMRITLFAYTGGGAKPNAGDKITIMAMRATKSTWVESGLDFDTRWGTIQQPVTHDANRYTGSVATDFEFIRGDGGHFDPFPSDGAYTMFLYGGGEVDADAIDPIKNKVGIILRESKVLGLQGTDVGKTATGGSTENMLADQLYATKFTTGGAEGTTSKVFWRIDGGGPGSGTATFRAALYSDAAGEPDTLLGISSDVTITDTATASNVQFVLSSPVTLAASTQYWIAIHGDAEADSCRLYYDTVAASSRTVADTFSNGSPTTWDTAGDTQTNNNYTAYAEYSTDNGSAIYAWLLWNDSGLWFEAQRKDMVNGAITSTSLYSEQINASGLDPLLLHAWTVKLVGKSLDSSVVVVNEAREVQSNIWNLTTNNSDDWTFRNGRIGFMAELVDRDSYIDALVTAPVGYAILRTRVYESRDPVDGARLQAIYSPDANLFTELTGTDAFRDQTKTVSGQGSIRTLSGLTTNQFIVEDWNETYLDLAIWAPPTVTSLNQPTIVLNNGAVQHPLRMPPLKGAQWNYLYFELGNFKAFITGLAYSLSILPGQFPDIPLGYFWVDSVVVGRRKVAWGVRAAANAPFRRFKKMANEASGAVHFNPVERGRLLQLEVQALTADAWISEFSLFPHYAELGLPVYDQGFETR